MNQDRELEHRQRVYSQLRHREIGSFCILVIDGGNGSIEHLARFEGFDTKGNPRLYIGSPVSEVMLDIDKVGGYSSVVSISDNSWPVGSHKS